MQIRRYFLLPTSAVWLLGCMLLSVTALAQSNEWAWMNGPQTPMVTQYGTLGTPAATNLPGNRELAVSWTDSTGNLWLFGGIGKVGEGISGNLNDLWEFRPATGEWTWMGGSDAIGASGVPGTLGVAASGNVPSSRSGSVGWTDAKGDLWLFGGNATADGEALMSDLWEFSPSTNEWTWVGGKTSNATCPHGVCSGVYGTLGMPAAENIPGARRNAKSWTDAKGNFWLFGGYGYDASGMLGWLNDLWEMKPSTLQWTWISGSTNIPCTVGDCGPLGVYGVQGIGAAGNVPGSRYSASGWTDNKGDLWLWGGFGFDSIGDYALLNDLWKFDPTTALWTWMGGVSKFPANCSGDDCGPPGVYGTVGTAAATSIPGGRQGAASWTDSQGNFWLFGGDGMDAAQTWGYLNDLWEYSPATNQWTWINGSSTVLCVAIYCGQPGIYGTLQTPAPGNAPSGRNNAATWTDAKGNFWMFGGTGVDAEYDWGYFQDLWQFQPNAEGLPVATTPTISPGSGTYTSWITVTITDPMPGATIYYSIDGNPSVVYSGSIPISASETVQAYASASGYANSNLATANYVADFPQAATPTFSVAPGNYTSTQTVSIADTTPGATIYYALGAVPTAASAQYSGPMTVAAPETLEAIAIADNYLDSDVATGAYNIGSNPSAQWTWMGGSSTAPACSQCGQPGWYGTLQAPAAANVPASRSNAAAWTDSKGNFWMFGGEGPLLLNDLWEYNPSTAEWAWISGSNVPASNLSGVYGTLGTPAATNTPGARISASSWIDKQGNLWLFGGEGYDANGNQAPLNDLWMFSPSTKQWAWMGGSSALACVTADECSQSGVYGLSGTPAPGNLPGARSEAIHWTDPAGNFWLYGGLGTDYKGIICYLDDLWQFIPSINQWAWIDGNQACPYFLAGYAGTYDTVSVAAAGNLPWSLVQASGWADSSGNLWLFGGFGEDETATGYELNDMWEFLPSFGQWELASANSAYASGGSSFATFGTMGVSSSANVPGARQAAVSWTDRSGNFWLFGGNGEYDTPSFLTILNDLWEFKPAINQWTWMGGSSTGACLRSDSGICDAYGQLGTYGTLGTASSVGVPGSRNASTSWTDSKGNLWLFGGFGYDANGGIGYLNDLWVYDLSGAPPTAPPAATTTPVISLAAGIYTSPQVLTLSDRIPGAAIYYTTDGSAPNGKSAIYTGQLSVFSSETVQAIAITPGDAASGVATASYVFSLPQTATPTLSPAAATYPGAQTVAISDATAGAAIYYTINGATPDGNSTNYTGPISVSSSETIQAIGIAPGTPASGVATASYVINLLQTATPTFTPGAGTYTNVQTVAIGDATPGATIYYTINGSAPSTGSTQYSAPITASSTETVQAIAVASGFSGSSVASATYTLNPPAGFSISASPASLTVSAGQSGTIDVTVAPTNGFNAAITFSCARLPAGTSCSFSPTTATPLGGLASTTLTVITSASAFDLRRSVYPLLPGSALSAVLCFYSRRRRLRVYLPIFLVVGLAGLSFLSACGGAASSTGLTGTHQPVSATVTVNATAGSLQNSTTFSLTVN